MGHRSRLPAFLAACALGLIFKPASAEEHVVVLSDGDGPAVVVRYDVDPCDGTVAFDASESTGSAPDCRISRFQWWFGERKAGGRPESRRPEPVYQCRSPGEHWVTLIVSDQCRKSRTATLAVHVPDSPISAELDGSIRPSKQRVSIGESVTLRAVIEDRGIAGLAYEWDFNDGSPVDPRPQPTHVFENEGVHTVALTVTDACGRTGTATTEIAVGPADPPPTIDTQFRRVIDHPVLQPGGSSDPNSRTEMQLPQPVVCGLSEAVSGVVASDEGHADGAPAESRSP